MGDSSRIPPKMAHVEQIDYQNFMASPRGCDPCLFPWKQLAQLAATLALNWAQIAAWQTPLGHPNSTDIAQSNAFPRE